MNNNSMERSIRQYEGCKEIWGNLSEIDIENTIENIEDHADYWNNNIHGLVFVFVRHNTGFNACIFYPTSRRETTKGEFAKLGLNLRNGTIVDASLFSNTVPVVRGRLSKTINGAYSNIKQEINKAEKWAVDNWAAENSFDKLEDWLPINLTRSIIIPNDTLEYLQYLTQQVQDNTLRDTVWNIVCGQIHFMKNWNKGRVVNNIITALRNETTNSILLTDFMQNLSTLSKELQEISFDAMSEQVQQLQTRLDKIDYSYAWVDGFQVPSGSTQAKKTDTQKVKRSSISILCFGE